MYYYCRTHFLNTYIFSYELLSLLFSENVVEKCHIGLGSVFSDNKIRNICDGV